MTSCVKHSKATYNIIITDYTTQLKRESTILVLLYILFYVYVILGALLLLFVDQCYDTDGGGSYNSHDAMLSSAMDYDERFSNITL